MTELRSYARVGSTLYLVTTGDLFRGAYETVVFAVSGQRKNVMNEVHRQFYDKKEDAVRAHREIFDSLRIQ